MTEASHNVFIDRRTSDQRAGELATQILFWYDEEGKGKSWRDLNHAESTEGVKMKRRQVNGIAITTDGVLIVARATCSRKDQFVKAEGRMKVEKRILGRAQKHCWVLALDVGEYPEMAASAYAEVFPGDERGVKRVFNAGKIFAAYKADIERRANELDEFNG